MFALIAAGQPVQTDFVQVDMTHCVFSVPHAESINHVVVFLTGQQAFPDGLAGAVYFSFPSPGHPPSWQYLGYISNDKPSAIFRITKWKPSTSSLQNGIFNNAPSPVEQSAQLGISIEPFDQVKSMSPAEGANVASSTSDAFQEFSRKMLENFIDYAGSFAIGSSAVASSALSSSDSLVPLSVVQRWYDTFSRRLNANPYFWRN